MTSSGNNKFQTTATATTEIPVGTGKYVFINKLGNSDRPITVYTYRPASWNLSDPVLIVMHGAGRDASASRDVWVPYSEKYSTLLIAPEFSNEYYPGDSWYTGGNMFDMNGTAKDVTDIYSQVSFGPPGFSHYRE